MSSNSSIEWTDATWNPVRGCTKVSPGCKHCYAETFAERWRGIPGHPYEQGFDLRLVPDKITEPLHWAKPRTVFVNSMSDLLHDDVPTEYVALVAEVMQLASWHGYQLLTKRAERLEELSRTQTRDEWVRVSHAEVRSDRTYVPNPASGLYELRRVGALDLPNVIVGVSVEDRKYGVPRIEHLRRANVRRRFLSIEPLLEDLGDVDLASIDWVIVGGESGLGARYLDENWVRRLRDQCTEQSVPFFFKQWGGVRKGKHGRVLDGRTHDEMPTLDRTVCPTQATRRSMIIRIEQTLETGGFIRKPEPVSQIDPEPEPVLDAGWPRTHRAS